MYYIFVIILAYLLGYSSMSYYIARWKGIDIQNMGSKNLGASNAMMLFGWKWGIVVGIHDIAKAALAVIVATKVFPNLPYIGAVAGISCVIGHIFPFYLKFNGGKGFASYLGMTLALNWKLGLVICFIIVLATLITDYIVVGTTLTITIVPTFLGIVTKSFVLAIILLLGTLIIIYKHRMNYVRIIKGTEIGFRSANRGDHRA